MNTVVASENIKVSVESSGELERRMTVQVPAEQIEREIDARLLKVRKSAKLKGFRPGKAPQKIIRQRYGGEVRQEVVSDVIRKSYSQAIVDQSLKPAGGPMIEPLPEDDAYFGFRAVFEVYPEIEIGQLEKLAVELPEVEIGESDVDDMIEKLRQQRSEWHTVDRKAAEGDRVTVDFAGTLNGDAFEGGEGKGAQIVIGEGRVIDDFDKALRGLSAGDKKQAKVKFPKVYGVEQLAGRKAVFEIEASAVEERVLPEIDDEFLTAYGIEEGVEAGGIDKLREEVRGNMERELNERLKAERKSRALDALLAANPIAVPRALVQDEVRRLQADAMQRMGIDDPQQAPPAEQFADVAQRRVALGLLVEAIIAQNNLDLDRDRVDERVEELAAPYDQPAEAARAYRGSRDLMAQVEAAVLEDQVVDFLLEQCAPKDKKLSFDQFMNG